MSLKLCITHDLALGRDTYLTPVTPIRKIWKNHNILIFLAKVYVFLKDDSEEMYNVFTKVQYMYMYKQIIVGNLICLA